MIVTLGARGALVATPEGLRRIPPVKVQALDTTGAGDAFIGSFARYFAAGIGLEFGARQGDPLCRQFGDAARRAEIVRHRGGVRCGRSGKPTKITLPLCYNQTQSHGVRRTDATPL